MKYTENKVVGSLGNMKYMNVMKKYSRTAAFTLAMLLLIAAFAACSDGTTDDTDPVTDDTSEQISDTEPPVIHGAKDIVTVIGREVSYRSGVTVTDDTDENVTLKIDSSAVDLNTAGVYTVTYSAVDKSGNETVVSVTVTVKEASDNGDDPDPDEDAKLVVTQKMLDGVIEEIFDAILTPEMSKYEQAQAIFTYVNNNITYVATSDKTDWVRGAYLGLTRGKGDCYNYWAASKALLTAAGIDNLDLEREGGESLHFWNLVNLGDGWYHFDTCWHPKGYALDSFMMTEDEAIAYTEKLASELEWPNYYTYDYSSCPVTVVGTPKSAK